MEKYNNEAYKNLIETIINDAFYVDGLSYDAKIALIRRYAEIILRRLLGYASNDKLTLGDSEVKEDLKKAGYTEKFFRTNLDKLAGLGNKRTHTQSLEVASKEDFEEELDTLFNLYGYLFYKFFKKYPFGNTPSVVSSFSILPPIIREIALTLLFNDCPNNVQIIDRLALAKLKAHSFEDAERWLKKHRNEFDKLSIQLPENEQEKLINKFGHSVADIILKEQEKSIYEVSIERINILKNKKDFPYNNFEEAVDYYRKNGVVQGNSDEINEFNDLMEFVYIGRRKIENSMCM